MTKAKKPAGKVAAPIKSAKPDLKKHPKKNYLVDDEDDDDDERDEDLIKDDALEDEDDLDVDLDDADVVIPKTFDPFVEDDEDEDDF
ncbi:MAG: hypothetical protein Q8M15_17380 [Bacteroidota bacterium]|nr:hypothetical protein [Bacteroidota bacterium]